MTNDPQQSRRLYLSLLVTFFSVGIISHSYFPNGRALGSGQYLLETASSLATGRGFAFVGHPQAWPPVAPALTLILAAAIKAGAASEACLHFLDMGSWIGLSLLFLATFLPAGFLPGALAACLVAISAPFLAAGGSEVLPLLFFLALTAYALERNRPLLAGGAAALGAGIWWPGGAGAFVLLLRGLRRDSKASRVIGLGLAVWWGLGWAFRWPVIGRATFHPPFRATWLDTLDFRESLELWGGFPGFPLPARLALGFLAAAGLLALPWQKTGRILILLLAAPLAARWWANPSAWREPWQLLPFFTLQLALASSALSALSRRGRKFSWMKGLAPLPFGLALAFLLSQHTWAGILAGEEIWPRLHLEKAGEWFQRQKWTPGDTFAAWDPSLLTSPHLRPTFDASGITTGRPIGPALLSLAHPEVAGFIWTMPSPDSMEVPWFLRLAGYRTWRLITETGEPLSLWRRLNRRVPKPLPGVFYGGLDVEPVYQRFCAWEEEPVPRPPWFDDTQSPAPVNSDTLTCLFRNFSTSTQNPVMVLVAQYGGAPPSQLEGLDTGRAAIRKPESTQIGRGFQLPEGVLRPGEAWYLWLYGGFFTSLQPGSPSLQASLATGRGQTVADWEFPAKKELLMEGAWYLGSFDEAGFLEFRGNFQGKPESGDHSAYRLVAIPGRKQPAHPPAFLLKTIGAFSPKVPPGTDFLGSIPLKDREHITALYATWFFARNDSLQVEWFAPPPFTK